MGGTYALVLEIAAETTVEVGALGRQTITPGGYAYVGSALGSGGFGRVDRHRRVAAGEHDVRHWHVDYLLGADPVSLESVVAVPDVDCECALARGLDPGPIPGFGSSDCDCRSHLADADSPAAMRREVVAAAQSISPADCD